MSIKKSISLLLSAVTALTCMPEVQETASAAASYPVQKFRLGIGDTNRNVNISDTSSGSRLTSDLQNGTGNEKWQLNYISADVYEIVKALVDTGFDGYVRPDHGRMIWGETGKPGYGLFDRALGATYINGLFEACEKAK